MTLKFIKNNKIKDFLEYIKKIQNNPRFNIQQFLKLLNDKKVSDWIVFENNNDFLALCVIREFPLGIKYIREIQSIKKGSGKYCIKKLLDKYKNIWWTADFSSGENLLNYYRQFDVKELNLGVTIWSKHYNADHYIFYKTDDKSKEQEILNIANSWKQSN